MGSNSSKNNKKEKNDNKNSTNDSNGYTNSYKFPEDAEDMEKNIKRLHVACKKENLEAVKMLISKYKVPVTEPDLESGKTSLHYCISNKDTLVAMEILKADESVLNSKDDSGFTPFLSSVVAGNLNMVKFLKEEGANLKTTDNDGHSATHWAAVSGQSEILDYLNQCGLELSGMDKNGATPLHYAVHGSEEVSKDQSLKLVKMLLTKKVKVDAVDEDKRSPLIWASSSGREKICEALLDAGANVELADQDGLTSLHSAAAKGHPRVLELLLRRGAKVEACDKNKCTPLFYTIHQNEIDCSKILLERKADPDHCDKKGRSVSHCAASIGNLEAIKLLKKYKADLWISSHDNDDLPIHEAAINGHKDVVQYLLENSDKDKEKENVNKTNANGKSCLHLAALSNNFPLTKYLVEKGSHINTPMTHGDQQMNPYDCAVMQNNQEIADYLRDHGGRGIREYRDKVVQQKPTTKNNNNQIKKTDSSVQTIENKNSVNNKQNNESQTSYRSFKTKGRPGAEMGVQTSSRKPKRDDEKEYESESGKSPKKYHHSPKKASSDEYSESESDSGNGESDDGEDKNRRSKKKHRKKKIHHKKADYGDYVSPYKYYPNKNQPQEKRKLVNLNLHQNIIKEQVRAYETKRLAAMKLNHANRMQMAGRGLSEERLVRKLARDYNDDARPEDRIPSGYFKTMKDFHNFLKGEIDIADMDEKRLKKLEKVKPIYYITF